MKEPNQRKPCLSPTLKRPSMRRILLSLNILLFPILLTGCNPDLSECPALVPYGQAYLDAAARELMAAEASGKYPHVVQMVNDFGNLRAACRALGKR
jgi:hypothetical protein